MSDPHLARSCFTIPALANSDQKIDLNLKAIPIIPKGRTVWRYCHADWEKAHRLIEGTYWDSLLNPGDKNISWKNWSVRLLEILQSSIPTTTLPQSKLVQAIRRRNVLYKNAKVTNEFTKYKHYRNKTLNSLRSAKKAYFCRLNPRKPKDLESL